MSQKQIKNSLKVRKSPLIHKSLKWILRLKAQYDEVRGVAWYDEKWEQIRVLCWFVLWIASAFATPRNDGVGAILQCVDFCGYFATLRFA